MTQEQKAKAYDEALKRAKAAIDIAADKDLVKGVATTIFPELRESESEDERIRKNLIRMVQNVRNDSTEKGYYDISFDKYIAWLEKQKELMPPVNVDPCDASWDAYYQRGLNKGYELGLEAGRKEQKPISQEDFDKAKHEALWGEQKPELVQQPPITYTYPSNASRDERLKAALLALLNSDLLKVKEGGYFTKQDLIDLVDRIPTDKPAWSEEDKRAIDRACVALRAYANGDLPNFLSSELIGYADRLQSLRPCPSWKPTEEQMKALDKARRFIPYNCDILESLYEQLKKL